MNREYNSRVSSKNSDRLLKNWQNTTGDYFFCRTLYIYRALPLKVSSATIVAVFGFRRRFPTVSFLVLNGAPHIQCIRTEDIYEQDFFGLNKNDKGRSSPLLGEFASFFEGVGNSSPRLSGMYATLSNHIAGLWHRPYIQRCGVNWSYT